VAADAGKPPVPFSIAFGPARLHFAFGSASMTTLSLQQSLVDFQCPHCKAALSFAESRVGSAQECPVCFKIVVVPARGCAIGTRLPLPITTPRLRLRLLAREDLPDWLEVVTDEESYTDLDGDSPDEDTARAWFERSQTMRLTDPEGYIALGIEAQQPLKLIGSLSFYLFSPEDDPAMHRQGGFQIMLHRGYRRRGYASEAVRGLFDFAFHGIGLHDVRVSIDRLNISARRMVEKAGMILEGDFVEDRYIKHSWVSTAWYRILKTEYEH
jgi:RimJ/RimL family protein N-acetyltransferase